MLSFVPSMSARLAGAIRAAGAGGLTGGLAEPTTLLDGTAPPPLPPDVDIVPCHGPQKFTDDDARAAFAEYVRDQHQPTGGDHRLRLPFAARDTERRCAGPFCRGRCGWPCDAARWAAEALAAYGNGQDPA